MKVSFDIDLAKNPHAGKFIVLEGLDGSGKTTQVEEVAQRLEAEGKPVITTKEPTDGVIGKMIRQILGGDIQIPLVSFQYLFAADRAVHQEEILGYLKEGKWVISDRYFWSSIAYGMADKDQVDYENANQVMLVAQSILSLYNQFVIPDTTIILDVTLKTAVERLSQKAHREIYEREAKLEKIQKGYDWLMATFPDEIKKLDGEKPVTEVTEEILKRISV